MFNSAGKMNFNIYLLFLIAFLASNCLSTIVKEEETQNEKGPIRQEHEISSNSGQNSNKTSRKIEQKSSSSGQSQNKSNRKIKQQQETSSTSSAGKSVKQEPKTTSSGQGQNKINRQIKQEPTTSSGKSMKKEQKIASSKKLNKKKLSEVVAQVMTELDMDNNTAPVQQTVKMDKENSTSSSSSTKQHHHSSGSSGGGGGGGANKIKTGTKRKQIKRNISKKGKQISDPIDIDESDDDELLTPARRLKKNPQETDDDNDGSDSNSFQIIPKNRFMKGRMHKTGDSDDSNSSSMILKYFKKRFMKRKPAIKEMITSDEDDEQKCSECDKVAKTERIIQQMKDHMRDTQTMVDQMLNNLVQNAQTAAGTDNGKLVSKKADQTRAEVISAGITLNTSILGIYLSLLTLYNENVDDESGDSEKMNVFNEFLPKMVKEIGTALGEQKGSVQEKFEKYLDEIKYRQLAENGQFLPNQMLPKHIQDLLKSAEQKMPPVNNANNKKELLQNINFYINLYTEFESILSKQQAQNRSLSNKNNNNSETASSKLVDLLKILLSNVQKLLSEFNDNRQMVLDGIEEARRNPVIVNISSGSDTDSVGSDDSEPVVISDDDLPTDIDSDEISRMLMEASSISLDSINNGSDLDDTANTTDDQMTDSDDDDCDDDDDDLDDSDEFNDIIDEAMSKKRSKHFCPICGEKAKIEAMMELMKKFDAELFKFQNSEQSIPIINAIGTTFYGIKLAFLSIATDTEPIENDMPKNLQNFKKIFSNLPNIKEPIDGKMLDYLNITKNRLLVAFEAHEALVEAQAKNLKEIISNYSPHTPQKTEEGPSSSPATTGEKNKEPNVGIFIHLFTKLRDLLQQFPAAANGTAQPLRPPTIDQTVINMWTFLNDFTTKFLTKFDQLL